MACFAAVQKTFGAHGELIIRLYDNAPDEIDVNEPVFITLDGLPVPFYFKTFEPRGNNRALVVFEDMETPQLAEELIGKTLHTAGVAHPAEDREEAGDALLHYRVVDALLGELGVVTGFAAIPGNPCLQIDHHGREVMIPFHRDIVRQTDPKRRLLLVALPDGLLTL